MTITETRRLLALRFVNTSAWIKKACHRERACLWSSGLPMGGAIPQSAFFLYAARFFKKKFEKWAL